MKIASYHCRNKKNRKFYVQRDIVDVGLNKSQRQFEGVIQIFNTI